MARLFVAALLFGLAGCIFAEDADVDAMQLEYLKMLKCPGGNSPQLGPDGHALQCIPGGVGPQICSTDHSCWYNGFNYLCCPMEKEENSEKVLPAKSAVVKPSKESDRKEPVKSSKPIKYDEVPVEAIDIPAEEPPLGEQPERLTSAEIVQLTKTKSSTKQPKVRTFPTVTLVSEEQQTHRSTSVAPLNEPADQRKAPRISEAVFEETVIPFEPESPDAVLPSEAGDAASQKYPHVCPPASSPVLTGKEQKLTACLPRLNSCPDRSFCWFSTEEDYICCREPQQPGAELPPSEPATSLSFNSTDYELTPERIAQELGESPVSGNFGRENAPIWFKPQPEAASVGDADRENATHVLAAPTQVDQAKPSEAARPPQKELNQERLRQKGKQSPQEETDLVPKSRVAPGDKPKESNVAGSAPLLPQAPAHQHPPQQARYVPNAAGGYSIVVAPPPTQDDPNAAVKEAALQYYLSQIKRGWPYAEEFYRPQEENAQQQPQPDDSAVPDDQESVQRDAAGIDALPPRAPEEPQSNPHIEYNYDHARWLDYTSRLKWYRKK